MKKILILFFISIALYGQARQTIPDSIKAHRVEIEAIIDTNVTQRTEIEAIIDTNVTQRTDIEARVISSGDAMTGNLTFGDANQIQMGASTDLSILHDNTTPLNKIIGANANLSLATSTAHSIILNTNGTNRWTLGSTGTWLPGVTKTYDIGSSSYQAKDIYAEDFYVDGVSLTTTLSNIVTGGAITTGLSLADNVYITLGTGGDFTMSHDGVQTTNLSAVYGNLVLKTASSTGDIYFHTNGSYRWGINQDGDIDPYAANTYDIGSTNTVANLYLGTNLYLGGATIGSIMSDSLDQRLTLNSVSSEEVLLDTVDFANKNIVHSYLISDEQDIDIYFKNYTPSITQKVIIDIAIGNSITVNTLAGKTLYWQNSTPISVTETGTYIMWFSWMPGDRIEIEWSIYGAE